MSIWHTAYMTHVGIIVQTANTQYYQITIVKNVYRKYNKINFLTPSSQYNI